MKIILMTLLACLLLQPPARAATPTQYPVAVLDFSSAEELDKDLGTNLAIILTAQLSAQEGIMPIERQDLKKILGEQELGLSGTVSPDAVAKVGFLTGAKVIVTGRAFLVGNELMVVGKIIGVETSRVYAETVSVPKKESLAKVAETLAGKIATTIRGKGPSLLAPVTNREDRLAILKKAVQGKKLPSISISIKEQSVGEATLDPAAETELGKIFNDLGFEVLDPNTTTKKPDIEITGESFSEFGMRKGNLVSSRGRVECKAIDPKTGRILAVDRQGEVAVDLSAQMAGKIALQHAAGVLAERMIPRLVK